MMMARRTLGCTWGLRPGMTNWLYTRVIRPMLVYGAVVWWPKVQQDTAKKALSKVQRLACLGILGAMRGTSTASMEVVLNLPPLDIFVKGEARMAAYRMECNGGWQSHFASRHSNITDLIELDILGMRPDRTTSIVDLDKPYQVNIVGRGEWANGEPTYMKEALTWYTDGSRTLKGTGAGIWGARPRRSTCLSLGKLATVFQAEVIAIAECARINVEKGYRGRTIYINSDSKAALLALEKPEFCSKTVLECHQTLKTLAGNNKVILQWVPGHRGILGNEEADRCANVGSNCHFLGPEPVCPISYRQARGSVAKWVQHEHCRHWERTEGNIQAKRLLKKPSRLLAKEALRLKRTDLRRTIGFITGHWLFRCHLHKIGINVQDVLCRKCGEAEETAFHIVFECPRLNLKREMSLGAHLGEAEGSKWEGVVQKMSQFSGSLGFDPE